MRILAAMLACWSFFSQAQAFGEVPYLPYYRTRSSSGTACVTWSQRNLQYRLNHAGSQRTPGESEFTALQTSFNTWQVASAVCSDFTFIRAANTTNRKIGVAGGGNENVVLFRETSCQSVVSPTDPCLVDGSCGNSYDCWDHDDLTIALTTVTYSTRTGIAVDADIEFNAHRFFFTTVSEPPCADGNEAATCVAYDLQNTATHEIGHMVGLDHVSMEGSTMFPTAPLGEMSKRVIDEGTASGLCQTYPKGAPPVPCDELGVRTSRITARNTGTFGVSCVSSVSGAGPWLLLMAAFLGRRRSRSH